MNTPARSNRVKHVRGPVVSVPAHRHAVASPTELLNWVSSRSEQRPLAADLFCGAGGLSMGLGDAGYDVVLGIDSDALALETYAGLHPGLTLCRDLSDPAVRDEAVELLRSLDVEIVAGGPPCQPFSKAGASKIRSLVRNGVRSEHDDRRDLWRVFLDIVLRVKPRVVLLENVPDMAAASDTAIVRTLVNELELEGYAVHTALLRAFDHGVPQHRQRFFLVALAGGVRMDWPTPLSTGATVADAISDLPPVADGWRSAAGADGFLPYELPSEPGSLMLRARDGLSAQEDSRVYDHITRPVRDDDRVIFESMDSKTRYSEIDDSLKRYRDDIFDDKYKRLGWDEPSRSITAHIARDGYWYIHPDQTRTLTVREAARLQTFPDRVRFAGPPTAAFRQIGNAVPPLLAERVARSARDALSRAERSMTTSTALGGLLTRWFDSRSCLTLPWLGAPTAWSALQGHLLLERAPTPSVDMAWPAIAKLDTPEQTIDSADQLHDIGQLIGRQRRVERILSAARWCEAHAYSLATSKDLQAIPAVGPQAAGLAALADPTTGPTPVVVSTGTLRVASRVFGLPTIDRRKGSDGRLAVTRLLGGATEGQPDSARTAMAAVVELAASLCTAENPLCAECPLSPQCSWPRGAAGS